VGSFLCLATKTVWSGGLVVLFVVGYVCGRLVVVVVLGGGSLKALQAFGVAYAVVVVAGGGVVVGVVTPLLPRVGVEVVGRNVRIAGGVECGV
jgi:hypothetical protein